MKSAQLKYSLFAGVALLLESSLSASVWADDDGRYRAVVLQERGTTTGVGISTPRVFLIDSRDGHMWIWERNMPLLGPGKQSFGTVLTYQGRLKPGKQIGEIIYQDENSR
jgi:hypothetical protein